MTTWLLLQLVDGAFPSGGFAHSAGLEPSLHLRGIGDLEPFVDEALWQTGRTALPFVRRACEAPADLPTLDALFDATQVSHVANRASRAQGRSLAGAACRVFERPEVLAIGEHAKRGPAHHAVVFGAVFGVVGMGAADTQMAWLHAGLRGVLSAAVRLGIVGPLEAQQIQAARAPVLDAVLATCGVLDVDDAAMTAPLLELFGALHDRLDGRLFQS
ncbi:MAG: urease accessory protein [Myxococcales bacterium]|nr:urease accessory protein [Myxococcales bacterium]